MPPPTLPLEEAGECTPGSEKDSDEESDASLPELLPVEAPTEEGAYGPGRGSGEASAEGSAAPARGFRIDIAVGGSTTAVHAQPCQRLAQQLACATDAGQGQGRTDQCMLSDLQEEEYGYPRWPEEMRDAAYFRHEFQRMRADPRHNKNLGRSMDDQEFWNEAARLPWAKILLRREQHWGDRRNRWLEQHAVVMRNNRSREEVGDLLESCPMETKRLVAPILKYKVVEAVLSSINNESKETGVPFAELLQQPEVQLELQGARRRLDLGGEAEAARMQESLDALMARAAKVAEEERKAEERKRGRVLIDMEGLKIALEHGQKCKKDGLIEWERGNIAEALASWRQGDETLRHFRAPAHCINENGMISELHGALLRNVAQAAIKLQHWNEALDAGDRALELCEDDHKAWFRKACALEGLGRFSEARDCLDSISAIAVGRTDRDRIAEDCRKRWERLNVLEDRHAIEQQRMLQRGLRQGVFSSDRQRLQAKVVAKKAIVAESGGSRRRAQLPNSALEDRKRLTRDGAGDLLNELEAAYSDPCFVRRVDKLARDVWFDSRAFMQHLSGVALEVQMPILEKWGFKASAHGLLEMRAAIQDFTRGPDADPQLKAQAEVVTRALHGSPELRMYERVSQGA